jgi:hypothetical protein
MAFPEDRDWLADAGMSQYKDYAKYLRPNVGIPEDKLGMSMKQFREIEKQIREAVLSEKPKTVLDRIKKEKFGVVATANGANAAPDSVSDRDFMKWAKAQPAAVDAEAMKEVSNARKLTSALNAAVFDHILKISDEVLVKNGVNIQSSPNLRGKAFVAAALYFTADGVQYESLSRSMGPGSGKTFGYRTIGAFILDRPRGFCDDQVLTFIHLINSKGQMLGLSGSQYFVRTPTWNGTGSYFLGLNHSTALVKYPSTQAVEAYDITKRMSIDSQDTDASVRWISTHCGYELKGPFGSKLTLDRFITGSGDPISTMTVDEFDKIPDPVSRNVLSAVR